MSAPRTRSRKALEELQARLTASESEVLRLKEAHRQLALANADLSRKLADAELNSLESDSIVASCNCQTKTNEVAHHKPGCKYRLICERDAALAREAALRAQLTDESKRVRWPHSYLEASIESVEDDCENCCFSLGSINVVRYAVAVEIPDEWYVWWEDGSDRKRPDVRQLWGPFATKEEAEAQKRLLAAQQADAATGKTEGGK
jgi:hypothetical protein